MSGSLAKYLYQEELYNVPPLVTVVLQRPWDEYTPADRELLEKILVNIRQSTAGVRIITHDHPDLKTLGEEGTANVLVFGSDVDGLEPYVVSSAQGFSVLRADDLPALDQERKKRLWTGLREMFGV